MFRRITKLVGQDHTAPLATGMPITGRGAATDDLNFRTTAPNRAGNDGNTAEVPQDDRNRHDTTASPAPISEPINPRASRTHRPLFATKIHPRSHLAIPEISRLSTSAKERMGVARWMRTGEERKTEIEQGKRYGLAFHTATREFGARIVNGEIDSIDQLWVECREWRVQQHDIDVKNDQVRSIDRPAGRFLTDRQKKLDETREDYGAERRSGESLYSTPIAPGPYRRYEMPDRTLSAHQSAMKTKSALSSVIPAQQRDIDDAELNKLQLQFSVDLNHSKIELTCVTIYLDENNKPTLVDSPYGDIGVVCGYMEHTDTRHLEVLKIRVNELFQELCTNPMASKRQKMETLAEMHWLLAHAMFDRRGSAAKSELAVRSIATALKMDLPPFREAIAPDLEAFLNPLPEFKKKYNRDFFESSPSALTHLQRGFFGKFGISQPDQNNN